MFRARLTVSSRFILVLGIGFIFQAGISLVSLMLLEQALLQQRTSEVKHLLDTAYSIVDSYSTQAKNHQMTDAAAQQAASSAVRSLRYGNHKDFFIWTVDGASVVDASHPQWEGKNMLQPPASSKDPEISPMVEQLISACRNPQREGFATYQIHVAGQRKPAEKIAYTRLFQPWGWVIGTGAYREDLDATFRHQAYSMLGVFLGLIGIASLISFLLSRDLTSALQRLSIRVSSVVNGEFDGEVPGTERTDEVGTLARALLVLRDHSKEASELRLDQLTGLPNRKHLVERLKQATATSQRTQKYGGLLLIDMDQFKSFNDTLGHDCGDLLLMEIAQRLTRAVRVGDAVGRLGSDEFAVMVVDLAPKEHEAAAIVESIGEKILASLREPFYLGDQQHFTSASLGLTLFIGEGVPPEELLKQADLALGKSKGSGRECCRFFDPQMEEMVRARTELDSDLRRSIAEKQFELYYQPQIGPGGHVVGVEALIRWNHSRRGFVSPLDFIPLAEDTGLILPLGQWVLETACKQLAIWAGHEELRSFQVAVNVSSRQFQTPIFVEQVLETLERTGANPKRLVLELTESLLVENVDDVIDKMIALKAHGVRFSLDDFGTGYSSLSYLKRMPLDSLKIDRSFVRDVLTDPNDAAIAKTVVALAHALGLDVIAEGVETLEQKSVLTALGCHTFQGYLFSRPIPTKEFEEFVQRMEEDRSPLVTNYLY